MDKLLKSKFTLFLFGGSITAGVFVSLVSAFGNSHLALGLAVISLGFMSAASYWRLRTAQSTTTRMTARTGEGLQHVGERFTNQMASVQAATSATSSSLRGLEKELSGLRGSASSRASESDDLAKIEATLSAVRKQTEDLGKQLDGQRALLLEILIALDLRNAD